MKGDELYDNEIINEVIDEMIELNSFLPQLEIDDNEELNEFLLECLSLNRSNRIESNRMTQNHNNITLLLHMIHNIVFCLFCTIGGRCE